MFLVVYGHNHPLTEKYIYSFHIPLFLILSGFFFPNKISFLNIRKRFKSIMLPYFFWAFFLFLFWLFIGKDVGESATLNLSVQKNFLGIFYAQKGQEYMDWGLPLWFLPNIFVAFTFLYLCKILFKNKICYFAAIIILVSCGFLLGKLFDIHFVWSLDVALVSTFFIAFGKEVFIWINNLRKKNTVIFMIVFFVINLLLFNYNSKVNMCFSIYGNEFLFLLNGITGSMFIILLFRTFSFFGFLSIVGKFTILILALQFLALSVIKFFLMYILKIDNFNFSEFQKFYFAIIQIILIFPIGFIINKYAPILNGGYKKI
ncbi:MAG: acyltransferase family protein [Aestuariibaculum sp.]